MINEREGGGLNENWQEKPKYSEKAYPSATVPNTSVTVPWSRTEPENLNNCIMANNELEIISTEVGVT
jgi:hypothetical protein